MGDSLSHLDDLLIFMDIYLFAACLGKSPLVNFIYYLAFLFK